MRTWLTAAGIVIGLGMSGGCAMEGAVASRAPARDSGITAGDNVTDFDGSVIKGTTPLSFQNNSSGFTVPGSLQTGVSGNLGPAEPAPLPPPAPIANDAPKADPAKAEVQRQMIYSAALRLVVVSRDDAATQVKTIATDRDGFVDQMTSTSVTVRVPAARFDDAIAAIAKLGEIVDRNIKAEDITEQMVDLKARLENSEKTRERLLALLNEARRMEDTLKIEEELRRVTEILETMKGKMRYLQSQVAMSTIKVELNSPQPMGALRQGLGIPFWWIENLGDGLLAGTVQQTSRPAGIFGRGPKFTPPAGFVRYFQDGDLTEAMDPADLRVKVQSQKNADKGDLAFWTKLARRVLVESRSVSITGERIDGDVSLITGTREVAGKPYKYQLAIRRSNGKVVTYEAWGPADQFEKAQGAIEASAKTINPGW